MKLFPSSTQIFAEHYLNYLIDNTTYQLGLSISEVRCACHIGDPRGKFQPLIKTSTKHGKETKAFTPDSQDADPSSDMAAGKLVRGNVNK